MATIYQPIYLYPDDISLDMDNSHVFTSIVNGEKVTRYVLRIYNSSDTIVYEDDTSLSASEYVYNGEILEVTIPSANGCTNGNEYSWTITHYNGSANKMSYELPFTASTTPSLTITVPSTIDTFAYDFVGEYSQDENVPLKYWYFVLYDSDGEILQETERDYSLDISHKFTGFEDGETYSVKGFGKTQEDGQIESPLYEFTIERPFSALYVNLAVELNDERVSPFMGVTDAKIIYGEVTGSYSYLTFPYREDR